MTYSALNSVIMYLLYILKQLKKIASYSQCTYNNTYRYKRSSSAVLNETIYNLLHCTDRNRFNGPNACRGRVMGYQIKTAHDQVQSQVTVCFRFYLTESDSGNKQPRRRQIKTDTFLNAARSCCNSTFLGSASYILGNPIVLSPKLGQPDVIFLMVYTFNVSVRSRKFTFRCLANETKNE